MVYPIKTCVVCGEEFELRPDKPGFANRCPSCSVESTESTEETGEKTDRFKGDSGLNDARRKAMRDLLYRKDS
jgi:hypothetical protein